MPVLSDFSAETTIDRVHVLAELPGRLWRPVADAPLGERPAVVGRGSLPLDITVSGQPDVEAAALLSFETSSAGLPSRSRPGGTTRWWRRRGDGRHAARSRSPTSSWPPSTGPRGSAGTSSPRSSRWLVGGSARWRAPDPAAVRAGRCWPAPASASSTGRPRVLVGGSCRSPRRRRRRLVTDGSRRRRPSGPSLLDWLERPWVAVGMCVAVYLPFVLLGYGTDIDVATVLEAGRRWLDDGDYAVSRVPGAAIHEVSTALPRRRRRLGAREPRERAVRRRSRCGACRTCCAARAARSPGWPCSCSPPTRGSGSPPPRWATSCGRSGCCWPARSPPVATIGCSPACCSRWRSGCRLSTIFLVVAWLVAEQLGRAPSRVPLRGTADHRCDRGACWARSVLRAVVAVRRSHARLPREPRTTSPGSACTSVGGRSRTSPSSACWRGGVLRAACRACAGRWPAWRTSVAFRFGLLAFVVTEVVYLRFPFKPVHLIPAADGGRARRSATSATEPAAGSAC